MQAGETCRCTHASTWTAVSNGSEPPRIPQKRGQEGPGKPLRRKLHQRQAANTQQQTTPEQEASSSVSGKRQQFHGSEGTTRPTECAGSWGQDCPCGEASSQPASRHERHQCIYAYTHMHKQARLSMGRMSPNWEAGGARNAPATSIFTATQHYAITIKHALPKQHQLHKDTMQARTYICTNKQGSAWVACPPVGRQAGPGMPLRQASS